jgi:hypothetical protein
MPRHNDNEEVNAILLNAAIDGRKYSPQGAAMIHEENRGKLPLRLHKPGTEWLVELVGRVDGEVSICGLFHSTEEFAAKAFYDNARRIISCWYVEQVWKAEGKQ